MKKILAIFTILCLHFTNAYAITTIDITKGNMDPLPIAITDMLSHSLEAQHLGKDIAKVIESDLNSSGLFRSIDKNAFIETVYEAEKKPQFASWRQINAAGLVTGNIAFKGSEVEVNFRLWDVYGETQIAGKSYHTTKQNWRRVAHMIADEIYKRLTGEEGYFDTRIVYVAESGPGTKRVKRLAIMDQDGENHNYLTDGSNLVLTPRFSPNSHQIIYMGYTGRTAKVFLRDLATGKERVVGDFSNMTFAPRFSPDGKKVVMSLAQNGTTDLYMLDLSSMRQTRLTQDSAINTSPSFSPDGSKIVFNSDRGGKPQIYIMNADGSGQTRISFGDGSYGSPVWSPRGDLISFTKIKGGEFFIGVMKQDGSAERLITNGYLVEGQSWAPNGRVLVFTKQERGSKNLTAKSKIYTIDLTGYNERQLNTPMDASDPAWSPLL